MTTPFPLAGADPVGDATGWLTGHPALSDLIASLSTGEGPHVGAVNAPPWPRLRLTDTNADLRGYTGLNWVSLNIDVLGDPDGRPGKAALRHLAVATMETLREMCDQPRVGSCVFTAVTGTGPLWSPLAPANQPRYVLSPTLWSHPAQDLL